MTTARQPHWDHDYAYGGQGELLVNGLTEGLRAGTVRVETKTKRIRDATVYVETHHDPGRTGAYLPSGVSVTTADYWAFVIDTSGCVIWVPVARLHKALRLGLGRAVEGGNSGSCPTRPAAAP